MNLVTHAFSVLACEFELVTLGFELVTCEFKLVSRGFELVTHRLELATRGFELVTRVFTFPHSVHDRQLPAILSLDSSSCFLVQFLNLVYLFSVWSGKSFSWERI